MPSKKKQNASEDQDPANSLGFHDFVKDQKSSPLAKYQDLVIGDRKLLNLIKYEILITFISGIPGILGMGLRQKLYGSLFREFGKGVMVGTNISLRQPGKISIGKACIFDDLVRLSVRGSQMAHIQLGDHVFVGRDSILNVRDGNLIIGDHTSISSYCRIASANGTLSIGKYVLVAAHCYIGGGNHRTERRDIPMAIQGVVDSKGVSIGDDVWIGAHSFIADGVTIGKGAIIGAGSFVNKDIPEYCVAFGSPATVRKERS